MAKGEPQLPDQPDCLNCGSELQGQYCGRCGQRATNRLISLWELLRDAFGDLFEFDSRLWRTMIPLLIRPGRLTRDYLVGRRARYMPPFRMYLVLSVIFFVVAFFDPRDDLSLLFEPEPEPAPEEQRAEEDDDEDDIGVTFSGDAADGGFNIRVDPETGECAVTGYEELPEWIKSRLNQDEIEERCQRITADGGKTLGSLLLDNIPVALIVLLPLMALVLKGLYPLSRRYFVEHLLFFVHFHTFVFLILTLQILFSRLAGVVSVPDPITILVRVTASLYIPVYLYKAMRLVYGQGHVATIAKYVVLSGAYWLGATGTMLGAIVFALLTF
ncbi:MAG: DUF3667 domain-containing protein [Gammaproteobacteria bacterium]|nr:DUF3667 domain-containing protein [Gammaproteobacteria bacterium]NNF48765.1 DUF3667 domain-containing protein [Woeseiaceae bacterium]MBT8094610.1 DUF3667 domain-containing protein [Gammaproteobacteria bacterium]MBT8106375.1 DUF3667 domain-containing protein [Gammaproteobacteria bacterium]NNK26390.1 DUF3667 domain-containing protein [Woeseiaceae bacterium]